MNIMLLSLQVSALINRWEKKQDDVPGTQAGPLGGQLVDGQDNPPSMTSTPVTRRKMADGESQGRGHNNVQMSPLANGLGQIISGSGARSQR